MVSRHVSSSITKSGQIDIIIRMTMNKQMPISSTKTMRPRLVLVVCSCWIAAALFGIFSQHLMTANAFSTVGRPRSNSRTRGNNHNGWIMKLYSTKSKLASTAKTKTEVPAPITTANPVKNLPTSPLPPLDETTGDAAAAARLLAANTDKEDERPPPVMDINDFNFRALLSGDKPVLVDACSKHCGPCKLIEPTLEKFAEDYKDVVCVTKFDIQDRLSQQFKVELLLSGLMPQALPTLLLFYKGKVLTKWRGIIRYEQLQEMVEEYVTPLDFAVKSDPKSTADHNITDPNP